MSPLYNTEDVCFLFFFCHGWIKSDYISAETKHLLDKQAANKEEDARLVKRQVKMSHQLFTSCESMHTVISSGQKGETVV